MYRLETKTTEYIETIYSNTIPRIGEKITIEQSEGNDNYIVLDVLYIYDKTKTNNQYEMVVVQAEKVNTDWF